jgi:hypothetical protein
MANSDTKSSLQILATLTSSSGSAVAGQSGMKPTPKVHSKTWQSLLHSKSPQLCKNFKPGGDRLSEAY